MRVVIVPLAQVELHDAAAFYSERGNRELGLRFVAEFEKAVSLLVANPNLGAIFHTGVRRYSLRRFPYSVIYQVAAEEIRVVAVAHHRQRPAYWTGRK